MKRIIILISFVISIVTCVKAQSIVYLRGDSIKAQKVGGKATLVADNILAYERLYLPYGDTNFIPPRPAFLLRTTGGDTLLYYYYSGKWRKVGSGGGANLRFGLEDNRATGVRAFSGQDLYPFSFDSIPNFYVSSYNGGQFEYYVEDGTNIGGFQSETSQFSANVSGSGGFSNFQIRPYNGTFPSNYLSRLRVNESATTNDFQMWADSSNFNKIVGYNNYDTSVYKDYTFIPKKYLNDRLGNVDISTTNEIQLFDYTSDATSVEAQLTLGGGYMKFIEGTNISFDINTPTASTGEITINSIPAIPSDSSLLYGNRWLNTFKISDTAAKTWDWGDITGAPAFLTSYTETDPLSFKLADTSSKTWAWTDITGKPTISGTNTGDQTITNTSDATTHTATLSNSGGSIQLVEGANITLTTSGTGADGIVTIASTGGGATTFASLTDVNLTSLTTNDRLKWDGTDWINQTPSALKTDLSLNNVENTALSTWAGSTNLTTLGTIATGTWNATAIADNKIASALTGKTYNGLTLTANGTGFQIAGGTSSKTLVVTNNITLSGTDGSTLNIGAGGTLGSNAFTSTAFVPQTTTVNGVALTGNVTVTDANLSTSDITTNNFTTAKHGFVPKGTNIGNFLRDDGTWAAPSGGVSDGDKGDITVSGGGATWTVDNTAITYGKIQNVAANSFLANTSGISATVNEISTTRIPLFGSSITGTPSATTFLRGDGSWQTPSTIDTSNKWLTINGYQTGSNKRLTNTITQTNGGQSMYLSHLNYTNGNSNIPTEQGVLQFYGGTGVVGSINFDQNNTTNGPNIAGAGTVDLIFPGTNTSQSQFYRVQIAQMFFGSVNQYIEFIVYGFQWNAGGGGGIRYVAGDMSMTAKSYLLGDGRVVLRLFSGFAHINSARYHMTITDYSANNFNAGNTALWTNPTVELRCYNENVESAKSFIQTWTLAPTAPDGSGATHGSIVYKGATGWVNLGAGTAGQVLQTQGVGSAPTWLTLGGGTGDMILGATQTNTGAKTFNTSTLKMAGSTSGTIDLNATAVAGTNTATFPAYSGTVVVSKTVVLGSDYTNNSTTATEVTGLEQVGTGTGLFYFEAHVFVKSTATTNGFKFGVNHTGTATPMSIQMTYGSTGTTATSGSADDVAAANGGQIYEHSVATTFSTAGNLGPIAGVATIGANNWVVIKGVVNVTVTGNLEIWAGCEIAANTITVSANSFIKLYRIN